MTEAAEPLDCDRDAVAGLMESCWYAICGTIVGTREEPSRKPAETRAKTSKNFLQQIMLEVFK